MDITYNAALIIHVQIVVWTYVFNSLGYISKSGIDGSYHNSVFNFRGIDKQFSKAAALFLSPTINV